MLRLRGLSRNEPEQKGRHVSRGVVLNWSAVVAAVKSLDLECSQNGYETEVPADWTKFLMQPVPGSIESSCGPIALNSIEWLLINPIHSTWRGRLVAPVFEDRSEPLKAKLEAAGVSYSDEVDGILIRRKG